MAKAPPSVGSPWSDPRVILVTDQLEQVTKLQRDLASCRSEEERAMVCRQTRDSLLRDHENLEILSAICRDVMEASGQKCTSYKLDESWRQFTELAKKGAQLRKARAKALQTVAGRWGAKVTHHYGWGPMSHVYCQQLRAAAMDMDWPTFVRRLNRALLDRYWAKSLNVHPIQCSINPITRADITKVREGARCNGVRLAKAKSPGKAKSPETEKELEAGYEAAKYESESHYRAAKSLPTNLGLDRFGVIVREEFDDPATGLVPAGQDGYRANTAPSEAKNIALDRPSPIGHSGMFHTETARLLPAGGRNSSPLPPSPPSSPNVCATPTLSSPAESERALPSKTHHGKRAAPGPLTPETKRHRIRPPTLSAAADAQKIYDLLTKLQAQGSPLAKQPQFRQSLEWVREESQKDEGSRSEARTIASHCSHSATSPSQTATVTRRSASSFLDQVLLPSPATEHLAPHSLQHAGCHLAPLHSPQQGVEGSFPETARASTSPNLVFNSTSGAMSNPTKHDDAALHTQQDPARAAQSGTLGPPRQNHTGQEHLMPHAVAIATSDASEMLPFAQPNQAVPPRFQCSSFMLGKEQALWALQNHNAKKFTLILLQTAFDEDGRMGSCVTFTVPTSIAEQLTNRPGELPEQSSVTSAVPGHITDIPQSGARSAVLNGSSYFLNIPKSPNEPFITVWTALDVGEKISLTSGAPS